MDSSMVCRKQQPLADIPPKLPLTLHGIFWAETTVLYGSAKKANAASASHRLPGPLSLLLSFPLFSYCLAMHILPVHSSNACAGQHYIGYQQDSFAHRPFWSE